MIRERWNNAHWSTRLRNATPTSSHTAKDCGAPIEVLLSLFSCMPRVLQWNSQCYLQSDENNSRAKLRKRLIPLAPCSCFRSLSSSSERSASFRSVFPTRSAISSRSKARAPSLGYKCYYVMWSIYAIHHYLLRARSVYTGLHRRGFRPFFPSSFELLDAFETDTLLNAVKHMS